MKKTYLLLSIILLISSFLCNINAQTDEAMVSRLQERVAMLEEVCGSWEGKIGRSEVQMALEMEESSSAIGELRRDGMIYFLHCFAEDMDKTDNISVGTESSEYEYCVLEQSGGETTGIMYLSYDAGIFEGIYLNGSYPAAVKLKMVEASDSSYESAIDLEKLEQDKWDMATYFDTPESYDNYIREFPSGKYVDMAKAQIELLAAESALKDRDYAGTIDALKRAEGYITLPEEAKKMLQKALEEAAYEKYLESDGFEESIVNGIEFVNTFLYSEKRAEVSDKVAYMMASSPMYLAGTSAEIMLTYANTDETREYVLRQTKQAAKERAKRSRKSSSAVGFNFTIGGSTETALDNIAPIFGGHVLLGVGDNRNFFNFEMGARYRYWPFVNVNDPADKYDFHQLRLVIAPKFNIVRKKKSAFYMYVAPEAGFGFPIDMHAKGFYEANSLNVGGRVGIGYGMFELSGTYTYDYWPMVEYDEFTGKYSPAMVGVTLSICLSGSNRK